MTSSVDNEWLQFAQRLARIPEVDVAMTSTNPSRDVTDSGQELFDGVGDFMEFLGVFEAQDVTTWSIVFTQR